MILRPALSGPRDTLDEVNDTSPAARTVQIALLRQAGVTRRAAIALRLSDEVVARSRRALAERMQGASRTDVLVRWAELFYGEELARRVAERLRER